MKLSWLHTPQFPPSKIYTDVVSILQPKNLKDVLDNIIVFERPSKDNVVDSEGIFNEYKIHRERIKATEFYNTQVYSNLEILESMFYLTKSLIFNKCLTIQCPFTLKTITTSDYFLTILKNSDLKCPDIICNYYFRKENIVMGFSMGCGWNGHNTFPLYLSSLHKHQLKVIEIEDTRMHRHILNSKYYRKLRDISEKYDDSDEVAVSTVTSLYGSMSNLGHTLFNEITGLFLLDYIKLIDKVDNVMMGPYDPYLISKYFERNSIKISKFNDWDFLNGKFGKGVFFKYNHVFISLRCSKFILNHLRSCQYEDVSPVDNSITPEKIINEGKQVITIVLRCGSRSVRNQVDVIVDVVNILVKIFPDIFVIFDGFSAPADDTVSIGVNGVPVSVIRNDYITTVDAICKRINTVNFKSLIGKPIYTCVDWLRTSNVAIYTFGSGCVNAAWLCKVPGILFGVPYLKIYIEMDKVIYENNPKVSYLTDGIKYEENNAIVNPSLLVNEILKLNILNIPDKSRIAVEVLNMIVSVDKNLYQDAASSTLTYK
jgi:hypothetical protein